MDNLPKKVANLITENVDVVAEDIRSQWDHIINTGMDIQDPQSNNEYYVDFIIGANYDEPEPPSGPRGEPHDYPGSPGGWEWQILDVTNIEAYQPNSNDVVPISPNDPHYHGLKSIILNRLRRLDLTDTINHHMRDQQEY